MDYSTIHERLQAKADDMTHKTEQLKAKKPRKYADLKDKGEFWRSLADQLEKWMEDPNGVMPFSPKQVFFVSKVFPPYDLTFWDFWKAEKRKRGIWDNHVSSCAHVRGGDSQGLEIGDDNVIRCRDCGAELGQYVPLVDIDPVYAATSASVEVGDVLDFDTDGELL